MNRQLRFWLAVALILWPSSAWAHAHLKRSEPAAGSRIGGSPTVIRLWFSERPELSMTVISLTDAAGKRFALEPAAHELSDPLEISLRVITALPPGRYTLDWRTAASDGHPTHGTFAFTVVAQPLPPNGVANQPVLPSANSTSPTAVQSPVPSSITEEPDAPSSVGNSLVRAFSF